MELYEIFEWGYLMKDICGWILVVGVVNGLLNVYCKGTGYKHLGLSNSYRCCGMLGTNGKCTTGVVVSAKK